MSSELLLLLGTLFTLAAIGTPIAYAILVASMLYVLAGGQSIGIIGKNLVDGQRHGRLDALARQHDGAAPYRRCHQHDDQAGGQKPKRKIENGLDQDVSPRRHEAESRALASAPKGPAPICHAAGEQ